MLNLPNNIAVCLSLVALSWKLGQLADVKWSKSIQFPFSRRFQSVVPLITIMFLCENIEERSMVLGWFTLLSLLTQKKPNKDKEIKCLALMKVFSKSEDIDQWLLSENIINSHYSAKEKEEIIKLSFFKKYYQLTWDHLVKKIPLVSMVHARKALAVNYDVKNSAYRVSPLLSQVLNTKILLKNIDMDILYDYLTLEDLDKVIEKSYVRSSQHRIFIDLKK